MAQQRRLTGYRRPNGAVGTRNYVAILPVDDLSNAAAEGVAALIPGTMALPHAFGRLQFGDDLELTSARSSGSGRTPTSPQWSSSVSSRTGPHDWSRASPRPASPSRACGSKVTATCRSCRGPRRSRAVPPGRQRADPGAGRALGDHLTTKDGESDTTTGLGSCRITAYLSDRWVDAGGTMIFGETSELTGGEHLLAERCVDDAVRAASRASTTTTST